jgi:hypothetical protein
MREMMDNFGKGKKRGGAWKDNKEAIRRKG